MKVLTVFGTRPEAITHAFPHTVIPAKAGIQRNSGSMLLITVSPLPTMFQLNELYEPYEPN